MDLWTLLTIVFRRWYFSIPLVVLTVCSAVFAADSLAAQYRSSTEFLLIGPTVRERDDVPGEFEEINPYVFQTDGTVQVANSVTVVMLSQDVKDLMAEEGLAEYEIEVSDIDSRVVISSTSENPELAFETVQEVFSRWTDESQTLQVNAGAPPDQLITVQLLTPPSDPVPSGSSRLRFMALGTFLGLVFTAIIVVAADYRLTARKTRKELDAAPEPTDAWSRELADAEEDSRVDEPPKPAGNGDRLRREIVARS